MLNIYFLLEPRLRGVRGEKNKEIYSYICCDKYNFEKYVIVSIHFVDFICGIFSYNIMMNSQSNKINTSSVPY